MTDLTAVAKRIARKVLRRSHVGNVDVMDGRTIRGWAINPKERDRPAQIVVTMDDVVIEEKVVHVDRPDVAEAGLGPLRSGFDVVLPLAVNDGKAHRVEIRLAPNGPILNGGEISIAATEGTDAAKGPVEGLALYDPRLVAIRGWAANVDRVSLSFDRGETIDVPLTQDVSGFGPGGAQGFVYRIPRELRDGAPHQAHVFAGETALDGSPVSFSVSAGRPMIDVLSVEDAAILFEARRDGRKLGAEEVRGLVDGTSQEVAAGPKGLVLSLPSGAQSFAITDPDGAPLARFEMSGGRIAERDAVPEHPALPEVNLADHIKAFEAFIAEPDGRFDPLWYAWSQPDLSAETSPQDALAHYRDVGARRGASPGPEFDEAAARRMHPALAAQVDDGDLPCLFAVELVSGPGTLDSLPTASPVVAADPEIAAIPLPQPTASLRPDQLIYSAWVSRLALNGKQRAHLAGDEDAMRRDIRARPLTKPLPLVTVIMPSWNRAFTIGEAIQSVLDQSYPNWELIVSDDASEDRTAEVVRGFDDPRIRYMKFLKSNGAGARNKGLRHARGDIIAYLDSDNIWHPQFLDLMVRELVHSPGSALAFAAYLDTEIVGAKVELREISRPDFRPIRLSSKNFMDLNTIVHWRKLYDWMGGFDNVLPRLQDWDLALRYTSIFRPKAVNRIGVFYRRNVAWGQVTQLHIGSGAQDVVGEKTRRRLEEAHETLRIKWPRRPSLTIIGGPERGADMLAQGLAERMSSFADVDVISASGAAAVPTNLWSDPLAFGMAFGPILTGRVVIDACAGRRDWLMSLPGLDLDKTLRLVMRDGRVALRDAGYGDRIHDLGVVSLPMPIHQDNRAPSLLIVPPRNRAVTKDIEASRRKLLVSDGPDSWYLMSGGKRRNMGPADAIERMGSLNVAASLVPTTEMSPLQLSLVAQAQQQGVPVAVPPDPAPHSNNGLGAEWINARAAYSVQRNEIPWLLDKTGKLLKDTATRDRLAERGRLVHSITLHPDLVRERLADLIYGLDIRGGRQ